MKPKKNFFMRSYNFIGFLLTYSLLIILLSIIVKYLSIQFFINELPNIKRIANFANQFSTYSIKLGFSLLKFAFFLVVLELFNRLKNDKIRNYFKSIHQTMILRRFLTLSERAEKVMTIENQTVSSYNPINSIFNRAVQKSIVDKKIDTIRIFIKIPRTQQAQKLLKEMEQQIKDEISGRNPDYYFSSPTRIHNELWFEGKKR